MGDNSILKYFLAIKYLRNESWPVFWIVPTASGLKFSFKIIGGEGGIRTLGTLFKVRRFSKPLVSATHPPHL